MDAAWSLTASSSADPSSIPTRANLATGTGALAAAPPRDDECAGVPSSGERSSPDPEGAGDPDREEDMVCTPNGGKE